MSIVVADQNADLAALDVTDLIQQVESEWSLAELSAAAAVRHAIRVGHVLFELRERVPAGKWIGWIHENLSLAPATIYRCMRLAWYEAELADPRNIDTALDQVAFLPKIPQRSSPHVQRNPRSKDQEFVREEARRLRQQGLSYKQIAQHFGVAPRTAWTWMNPEKAKQHARRAEVKRKKDEEARLALAEKEQRQERDRLAKANRGSAQADAYAKVRQALTTLDRAGGSDVAAIALLHKAEDALVASMREGRAAS